MEETALLVIEQLNPVEIFTGGGLDEVIEKLRNKASEALQGATLETAKGRKQYASVAYKIARSKTLLDELGKDLTIKQKREIRKTDEERKRMRNMCEQMQVEYRQPLTDWEIAEQSRKDREVYEASWDEAIAENDLWNRQKEIERKEAEFARIEAEKRANEEAERLEQERIKREKRIAEEAAEHAKKVAEDSARKERERIEREKKDAEERAIKAEQDRVTAIERAKIEAQIAEQRRIEAEKIAKQQAEEAARKAQLEKEAAVKAAQERAKREADAKESARLADEARQKAEAEKIAKNKAHQAKVNREALECFVAAGFSGGQGKTIIELIARGKIKHITVNY